MFNKNQKNKDNFDKNKGARLKVCREYRGYTQEALSELAEVSTNYISMLERGERSLDWNKAVKFSEILNVSPSFIMCESDLMTNDSRRHTTLDIDTFGVVDIAFLNFLAVSGHDIIFHVINLFDGKKPNIKKIGGRDVDDWDSLHISASLDELSSFCLSDPHCKLIKNEKESEVIIREIVFDGYAMTFGKFVYTINRLYDYIHFTLDSLKDFDNDLNLQKGYDLYINNEIAETRYERYGLSPTSAQNLKELEAAIKKDFKCASIKLLSKDEFESLDETFVKCDSQNDSQRTE